MEQQQYVIEYLKIDDETYKKILAAEVQAAVSGERGEVLEFKKTLLRKLGIELQDGEKPVDAYCRHICKVNGLTYTKPIDRALADAIIATHDAMRMYYILA